MRVHVVGIIQSVTEFISTMVTSEFAASNPNVDGKLCDGFNVLKIKNEKCQFEWSSGQQPPL